MTNSSQEHILFTDISIKNLKPLEKRYTAWAKGLPGLGIRVSPSGNKSFVFKYDIDGQDRWMTFGRHPKMKLAEAFQKYGEAMDKIAHGDDPAEDQVQANKIDRNALTVKQLSDEYIEKYAKTHKRTWQEDERILKRDILGQWGAKRASKIERRDVIALLDDIVARGAPVQANRTLAVIRRMFNFGIDRDIIVSSPCYRIKPPAREKSKNRYLTLEEISQFWNKIETAPLDHNTKQALRLLLLTLQRCSEVIGMNLSEINLESGTWILPVERTKNKRSQLVTLSPVASGIIKDLARNANENGFLFPGKSGANTITVAGISRAIARNIDHFGIPKFTPHDLRRTGSTQLAAFKVPRFDRDRILNHTDKTIGSVYDIYEYQDEKCAALNLWADIIQHISKNDKAMDLKELRKRFKYQNYFSA